MEIRWKIDKREARGIAEFVREQSSNAFVRQRIKRNIRGERPALSKSHVWHALATCLLTTQQRSGPTSRVHMFISARPFPLQYEQVMRRRSVAPFVVSEIRRFGGLRRADSIGRELAENIKWFKGKRWGELRGRLTSLVGSRGNVKERQTADWLAAEFRGLGPKQSRNLLQSLGLTRFEIPIDSRITRWLNSIGFPVTLNASGLSDPHYYAFVSDGVQALSKAAGVYPCVLDAAVFSAVDGDSWNEADIVF